MNNANFTNSSQRAILKAQEIARKMGQHQIDALHLLYALLTEEDNIVLNLLEKLEVNIDSLKKRVFSAIKNIPKKSERQFRQQPFGQFYLTQDMAQVLESASQEAMKMGDEFISIEHLFLGMFANQTRVRVLLEKIKTNQPENLNYESLLKILSDIRGDEKITDVNPESKQHVIEKYTINLNKEAQKGRLDPVIGRNMETRRLMEVLSRRIKNNPILVGEPGVGKTAIVEGLVQKIVKNEVPKTLKNKEIISLDLGSLVAGTKYRGEFEDRIKALLKEIRAEKRKYILFIDEVHTLVGAGSAEGSMDASNLLKPALARGDLQAVGATTLTEYKKYIEKDTALERRLQPVYVNEPTIEDTVDILRGLKEKYELYHGVRIKDSALKTAVNLSSRYIQNRFLPDKAIDLIDEAMSALKLEIESEPINLYNLKTEIQKLKIEEEAIKKENKKAEEIKGSKPAKESQENSLRLKVLARNIADLEEKANAIKVRWESEKELIDTFRKTKKEIDEARFKVENLDAKDDLEKIAELKYEKIPNLLKRLQKTQKRLDKIQKNNPILKEEVSEEDLARVIDRWTGIPASKIIEEEAKKLEKMEALLAKRIIGQKQAIISISDAIRRSRAGLSEENRPLGSFIFLGPTGVGKTETVKALTKFLFNDEKALIRLDMSEYMEKHSVAKMIGSPPGYVAHEEGGQLTEKVKHRPYSVILFDEIEKAHPDVFNILLQILEDGHLTDTKGKKISFKNTILIMTSNLGSHYFKNVESMGFLTTESGKTGIHKKIQDELKENFKPEFLNRIDEIIIFNVLSRDEIKKIFDLEIVKIQERLLKSKNIEIKITNKARDFLIKQGFSELYGARPLKREIQRRILNPLSMKIISGEVDEKERLIIDLDGENIVFRTSRELLKIDNYNQDLIKIS